MLGTDKVLNEHQHDKCHNKRYDVQRRAVAAVILNRAGLKTHCAAEDLLVFEDVADNLAERKRYDSKVVAL